MIKQVVGTSEPLVFNSRVSPHGCIGEDGYINTMRRAMMVYRQPYRTMQENAPNSEPGTTAGSHLQHERDALESKTGDARNEARQKAHQAYDELKQGTRKIAHKSGSYLKTVAAKQQHLLVEKMEEYQDALRAASDQLESDDDTVAAKNIRKATGSLDSVVDYLRESEPDDLLSDAAQMARKHPELVFGGLFIAGLGVARVMKSSARERRHDEQSSNRGPYAASGEIRTSTTMGGSTLTPTRYE